MITTTVNDIHMNYVRTAYTDVLRDEAWLSAQRIEIALDTRHELHTSEENIELDKLLAQYEADFERQTNMLLSLLNSSC